jgi:hypothetical protein
MKPILYILISLSTIAFYACEHSTEKSLSKFPELLMHAGSDSDSSYISLQTIRQTNGELLAQVTGWGVEEYGLFLDCSAENRILTMQITGRCGTVFTHTLVKKVFDRSFSKIEEDTLTELRFTNYRDTVRVTK